jgi:hypothetical protein
VIHRRLVAEHGFQGHHQRVKVYVGEARPRLVDAEPEPAGFHRRFEVLPGAQAQVDWGDEGELQTAAGSLHAYSFHMVLSYSRDPFCCFTASQDLGTFWDCHRRAFAHFGGVPATIVYDRTKTVVRRHAGSRSRCTPRRSPSRATTASRSGSRCRIGPRPRGGLSGKSSWSEAMCCVAECSANGENRCWRRWWSLVWRPCWPILRALVIPDGRRCWRPQP